MTLATFNPDLTGLYDRLAPDYDRLHRRCLRHAGGEAQAALKATVPAVATPEMELLDAGCGTGAFARRHTFEGQAGHGSRCSIRPRRCWTAAPIFRPKGVKGRLEQLPFQSGLVDVQKCTYRLSRQLGRTKQTLWSFGSGALPSQIGVVREAAITLKCSLLHKRRK